MLQISDTDFSDIKALGNFIYRANGGNAGDCLIASAEFQLFDRLGVKYSIATRQNKEQLTNQKFSLVYGGGGGWVKFYHSYYQPPLNTYFKNPNLLRCIILPSSFWECDDVVDSFDERFLVFCRDRNSYNYCLSRNSRAEFRLQDDMALGLQVNNIPFGTETINKMPLLSKAYNRCKTEGGRFSDGIAYLMRGDCERVSSHPRSPNNFDISSIMNIHGEDMNRQVANAATSLMLGFLAQFNTIYTDRLHVMIGAHLLDKNIVAYDNAYGKLSSVYEMSLKTNRKIKLIKSL